MPSPIRPTQQDNQANRGNGKGRKAARKLAPELVPPLPAPCQLSTYGRRITPKRKGKAESEVTYRCDLQGKVIEVERPPPHKRHRATSEQPNATYQGLHRTPGEDSDEYQPSAFWQSQSEVQVKAEPQEEAGPQETEVATEMEEVSVKEEGEIREEDSD